MFKKIEYPSKGAALQALEKKGYKEIPKSGFPSFGALGMKYSHPSGVRAELHKAHEGEFAVPSWLVYYFEA